MTAFEREKAKNAPKRADPSSRAAVNSPEQTKPGEQAVNSTSDKKSPTVKSVDSDTDRRKFFQSLLQSKNGPKGETSLPKTIPEESESDPNSPVQGERKAANDDSSGPQESGATQNVIPSECIEKGDKNVEPCEDRPANVEDSLSATGVSSDVRGAEVAKEPMEQGTDLPDKGLDVGDGGNSQAEKSNVEDVGSGEVEISNATESSGDDKTETDATQIGTTSSSVEENKSTENDESDKRDELVDENKTGPSTERDESTEILSGNESEKLKIPEIRTESDSTQPEQLNENNTDSKAGQDLLDEKVKPKDVDSGLTIAMKSSYIGATSEVSEDTQMKSENNEAVDSKEGVVSSESVAKSYEQSVAQSNESSVQEPSVETSPVTKSSQPGSPSSPSQSGAESSPTSTPSGASASTSNAGSPDQKSNYRAHVNIPEYLWSPVHQRVLGDLLFAIESDVQVWRR